MSGIAKQLIIVAVTVSTILPATCPAQTRAYAVSVGWLTVEAETFQDFFSGIDFQVQIRRQDSVVQAILDELEDQESQLSNEDVGLRGRMRPLQDKHLRSTIGPGPPLTDSEREQLAKLSAMPSSEMHPRDRRVLRQLNTKDDVSKREPGPPLTPEEKARLQALTDRRHEVLRSLRNTRSEHSDALALIYGQTETIEGSRKELNLNSGPVLMVYVGDVVRVTVVDKDLFRDDVLGVDTFTVTGQMLEEGSVQLGRAHFVRGLVLKFLPTSQLLP